MQNNCYFLLIETASEICSVALACNDKLIDLIEVDGMKHSEMLAQNVQLILKQNQITSSQLNALILGDGPGSYTGLRIGAALAKGFCFSLNIPLIAISSLDAMLQMSPKAKDYEFIIPMIDARRMEVYTAVYNRQFKMITPTSPLVLDQNSFESYANNKVLILGKGAQKYQEICIFPFDFDLNVLPSAAGLIASGYQKFMQKDFCDLAYYEPNYLKPFVGTVAKKVL